MAEQLLNFYMTLFKTYGPEFVGSLILAFTIGFFYNQSTVKGGLKVLCFAFYVLAFKNIALMAYQVSPMVAAHFNYHIIVSKPVIEWVNLSLVCIASALFLSSALQILRFIFSGFTFSLVCSACLMGAGFLVERNSELAKIFSILPNIYIAAAFMGLGIALVFVQSAKQTHALRTIGLGFLFLGFYYTQSILFHTSYTWIWQAAAYAVVLFLSLASQINLIGTYCATLERSILAERAKRDLIINASPFPILISRLLDDSILIINPKAQKLFNLPTEKIASFTFSNYFADTVKRTELIARIKRENIIEDFDVQMRDPQTHNTFWVSLSTRVIDLDGEIALYTTFKDITTRKAKENELFEKASTDPLTGLFNRRQFETMARKEISKSWRYKTPCSILMTDIDFFKKINDTYGHQAGDEVLKNVAYHLKANLRDTDVLARFGGEEFVILLAQTEDAVSMIVAERLRESIENSVTRFGNHEINVTISIGVAPAKYFDSLDNCIKGADEALYQSKNNGRNRVTIYRPKDDKKQNNLPQPKPMAE